MFKMPPPSSSSSPPPRTHPCFLWVSKQNPTKTFVLSEKAFRDFRTQVVGATCAYFLEDMEKEEKWKGDITIVRTCKTEGRKLQKTAEAWIHLPSYPEDRLSSRFPTVLNSWAFRVSGLGGIKPLLEGPDFLYTSGECWDIARALVFLGNYYKIDSLCQAGLFFEGIGVVWHECYAEQR